MAQQTIRLSPPVHPYEGARPMAKADPVEKSPRPTRATRVEDDGAPKRPANAFMLFRSDYLKQHPESRSEQKGLSRKAGAAWRALPARAKAIYEAQSRENSARYKVQKQEYKKRLRAIEAPESDESEPDSSSRQSLSQPEDCEPSSSTSVSSWLSDVHDQTVPLAQDASLGCAHALNIPAATSFDGQSGGCIPPTTLPTLPDLPTSSNDWSSCAQGMFTQQYGSQHDHLPFPLDGPWGQRIVVDENYAYTQQDIYAQELQLFCFDGYSGQQLTNEDSFNQPTVPGFYDYTTEPAYTSFAYDIPVKWSPLQPTY
uniref:HMG box domain-containing protein n=1 Tax=Schizophyllum commune (strain H4-8 / FGSC 9210) TaxID=578458 RepID=D8QHM2_SCHCM